MSVADCRLLHHKQFIHISEGAKSLVCPVNTKIYFCVYPSIHSFHFLSFMFGRQFKSKARHDGIVVGNISLFSSSFPVQNVTFIHSMCNCSCS